MACLAHHCRRPPLVLSPAVSLSLSLSRAGQRVLGECPCEGLLAADLLAADEAVHCHGDCTVNVLR